MLKKVDIKIFEKVVDYACCCPTAKSCLTLCNPLDCSTPGFPVLHYLLEFAQTHVHWVHDAIQPSHLLSSPSLPSFNLSQQQWSFPISWLFASGGQIVGSFSFSISPPNEYQGWFPLGLTGLISLLSKGDSCCLQSLQHHSSKASVLWCSALFMVQLSSITWQVTVIRESNLLA